jgi:Pyrimidine dimer DNA glycosylase
MRVWDINPGYLSRQSLLGEHSEIHAVVSTLTNEKQGYARHPETRRWGKALWALQIRHDLVVSEMGLRGYHHRSPVRVSGAQEWPEAFIDTPGSLPCSARNIATEHSAASRCPARSSSDGYNINTLC